MTDTPIFIGQSGGAPTSGTNYISLTSGKSNFNNPETTRQTVIPIACTLSNLYVKVTTAPGGTASWTFKVYKNGVGQTVTCAITGAATTANDTTHTVSIAAGDRISLECIAATTPTAMGQFYATILLTSSVVGESLISFAGIGNSPSGLVTSYSGIQGTATLGETTITKVNQCMPCAGTLDQLYINQLFSNTTTTVYTLMVNGFPTLLTATLSAGTNASNLVNNVAVSAGDLVSIQIAAATGSTGSVNRFGMRFVPTIDGQSVQLNCFALVGIAGGTNYIAPAGSVSVDAANEANAQMLTQACTIKNMYMNLTAAPGAGNTLTHTVRKNAANQTVTAAITGGSATTANDTTYSDNFSVGDLISIQEVCSASINAANKNIGLVSYIIPPVIVGTSSRTMMMGMS